MLVFMPNQLFARACCSITGAIVRGVVEVANPQIPQEPLSSETPPFDVFLAFVKLTGMGSLFQQKYMKWKN